MHWLIVIPFYFFGALGALLLLSLVSRVLRLTVGANPLATAAVLVAVAGLAVPLAADWIDVTHLTGRALLVLGAATFVLAAVDTLLQSVLPSRVDRELSQL